MHNKFLLSMALATAVLLPNHLPAQTQAGRHAGTGKFIQIKDKDLIAPDGKRFFIKGTNLGNWLNPEGYMFGFGKTNSARFINEMFCQLVGPDFTAEFWKAFKTTTSRGRTSGSSPEREATPSVCPSTTNFSPTKTTWD